MLRQDPDIIMVGEIRDLETAQIAIQAALTGHLVLSTLHTNNAASTLTRLLDMGVEDYLLTSTAERRSSPSAWCAACASTAARPIAPLPELLAQLGLDGHGRHPASGARSAARSCNGTGYFGRISINEVLMLSDPIRRQILQHAEATELQRVALAAGMRPMFQDGIAKVAAGITTDRGGPAGDPRGRVMARFRFRAVDRQPASSSRASSRRRTRPRWSRSCAARAICRSPPSRSAAGAERVGSTLQRLAAPAAVRPAAACAGARSRSSPASSRPCSMPA